MNWTNTGRAVIAGLCLLGAAHTHAVGTIYVGFSDTSEGVSIRSGNTLTEIGSFGVTAPLEGIAAGTADNLYVAAGDSITNYNLAGGVLATDTVAGAAYSDAALLGASVFVTSSGATPGLSARDPITLVESDFFDTTFTPTSIEDGFGRLYITAGDTLFIFAGDGTERENTSTGTAGVVFVDSALSGTRLYAAIGGTANGISVRNPINLVEITSFALPFAVDGLVAGDNDDLYITSGNEIFRYSTAGVELDAAMDATTGRTLSDVAFIADPLAPAAGTVLAITADGANSISQRDAESLVDAGSFAIAAAATGAALGANDELYLAAGDSLFHYDADGTLLTTVTDAGAVYADVAFVGADLVVATGTGVSVRDATTLVELSSAATGFAPSSVAAAANGEIYLTSANEVFRFSGDGVTELQAFSGDSSFTYTDVALVASVVYAAYNSPADNGISVLDPGSLQQLDIIDTGAVAATGITPGGGNDYYISGGDTIVHYALDEVLATFSAGAGVVFPDVVFSSEASDSLTNLVASTLPGVRSVQVGDLASAFATVINIGPVTASGCRIEPNTTVAADFSYQTTDGGTNELVGTPDTPTSIASNGLQTFFFSFVPTAAFTATDIQLDFICDNAPAAPSFPGLNTLLLSADTAPVPDVIALATTPFTPGIIDVPGVGGTGFFAVASVNVGVSGDISVEAVVTDGNPAIILSVCQTDPATALCINPTVPTTDPVLTTIGANETPTFSIFAAASEAIALDPALTRIRVDFNDQVGGAIRGATSVAIRTE